MLLAIVHLESSRRSKQSARLLPGRSGCYQTAPPTDPDVSNSLIRFLGKLKGDESLSPVKGANTPLTHHFATLHFTVDE